MTEFLVHTLDPLPRIAVDYSRKIVPGARVHFRSHTGHTNARLIARVVRAIGPGPYTVVSSTTDYDLHVRIKNGGEVEQIVPVHLLLPIEVTNETDIALSQTRFRPEDDEREFCANYVLVRLKAANRDRKRAEGG